MTMSTWRKTGFSGILTGLISLALILPGCGGGGGAGTTTGPNQEVKIEWPKDASGKEIKISDETKIPGER
jgi:hypothetical protein